jgi:predicted CopG family antitoxin
MRRSRKNVSFMMMLEETFSIHDDSRFFYPAGLRSQVSSNFMANTSPEKQDTKGQMKMVSVSLSKKALARLRQMQKEGESISDVILRIGSVANCADEVSTLANLEGSLEFSEIWDETEKKLYASRLISRA